MLSRKYPESGAALMFAPGAMGQGRGTETNGSISLIAEIHRGHHLCGETLNIQSGTC